MFVNAIVSTQITPCKSLKIGNKTFKKIIDVTSLFHVGDEIASLFYVVKSFFLTVTI